MHAVCSTILDNMATFMILSFFQFIALLIYPPTLFCFGQIQKLFGYTSPFLSSFSPLLSLFITLNAVLCSGGWARAHVSVFLIKFTEESSLSENQFENLLHFAEDRGRYQVFL